MRLPPFDLVSNGLHQVGLAHAYAAVQEERVIGFGGPFRHRLRRRVSKLVAGTDHECAKRVLGAELRG